MKPPVANPGPSGTPPGGRPDPSLLSIVIPVFNEEKALPFLRKALEDLGRSMEVPVELVLVDDGSWDGTAEGLLAWSLEDPGVKTIRLSRNFGHQAAISAGLDHASGDAVVIMDADLQDPPEIVLEMLRKYREGYDVVYAQRVERIGEGLFKRWSAAGFYWIMRKMVHKGLPQNVGDFRLMSRPVVDGLRSMRETHRFIRGMVSWLGFSQIAIPFSRPKRVAGDTKYPFRKMARFAIDAILSFSALPIRLVMGAGVLFTILGLAYAVHICIRRLVFGDVLPGFSAVITLLSIFSGLTLVCMGVMGEYVARIYDECKGRPLYVVREKRNFAHRGGPPSPRPARRRRSLRREVVRL